MKKTIMIFISVICALAFGRIGETYKELVDRYGEPTQNNKDYYVFEYKGFHIEILIYEKVSIAESFEIKGSNSIFNEDIPDNKLEIIIKSNLGEKYTELETNSFTDKNYVNSNKIAASYKTIEKKLYIYDFILFSAWQEEEKKKTEKEMEGF